MPFSRRRLLNDSAHGFGALAAAVLLNEQLQADTSSAADIGSGGILKSLHHPPRAKRVVQLFMGGAASHVDLWDHKPSLEKHHGQPSDFGEHVEAFQNGLGPWMKSPFAFRPYG
ncbi:MAG: DUF1501 domain-containing protein, partial [Planctomycetaceae bacterium]|nr:DUF1501 domain-containing protein [Planctomycetaceae bacterium]